MGVGQPPRCVGPHGVVLPRRGGSIHTRRGQGDISVCDLPSVNKRGNRHPSSRRPLHVRNCNNLAVRTVRMGMLWRLTELAAAGS
jgi:hypothetical protein